MENIIITGKPRTGKTTLIKKLIPLIPAPGGFYTDEILEGNMRTGFKITTLDGKSGILARKGIKSTYRLGKYGIEIRDLEELGVKAIEYAMISKKVVIIDEIGKMELFSSKFQRAVINALDSETTVLGVLQISNTPFLNKIRMRKDIDIYTLIPNNRDEIFHLIKKRIMGAFFSR
jgi:nucleoside-triphosphatase